MDRRTFLALTTTGFTGLAGCSSSDGSANTTGGLASTPTPDESEPSNEYVSDFRRDLEGLNLDIRTLDQAFPIVNFVYETPETQYQAVSDQIGRISGLFFKHIKNGWDATRLNAEAYVLGEPELTWYARAEWYNQYASGDITADDLTLKVLETVSRDGET